MTECQWKLKETLPWLTSQLCSDWILFPPRYRPAVTSLCSTVTTVLFCFPWKLQLHCTAFCCGGTYDLSASALSLSKGKIPATLIAKTPNLFWTAMRAVINVHCSSSWRVNASEWQLIHQDEANSAFTCSYYIGLILWFEDNFNINPVSSKEMCWTVCLASSLCGCQEIWKGRTVHSGVNREVQHDNCTVRHELTCQLWQEKYTVNVYL